jgi:hypothetical protein
VIELRIARGAQPTGQLLATLLTEKGLHLGRGGEAIVSYGCQVDDSRPTLNANAGRLNKFEELTKLRTRGVTVPNFSLAGSDLTFPVLGRKFRHACGTDVVPILQNDKEFEWQRAACNYFVQYVARAREFRVWSYRRRCLAAYEKVMRYPERYRTGRPAVGWNWDRGFAFTFLPQEQRPQGLVDLGCRAVQAMDLDFGAVDVIQSTTGELFVLETNSAAGVQDVRQGIDGLANRIVRWVNLGYPRRSGSVEQSESHLEE